MNSLLMIVLCVACKVNYTDTITVQRYDSSPFSFKITHLWTGTKNSIIVPYNLLSIWSDNGTIDTMTVNDMENWYITPKQNGKTCIYTLQKITDKYGNSDTIINVSLFKSLTPPKIKTVIDTNLLRDSAIIKYGIVSEKNGKSILSSRYQYGALELYKDVFIDNQKIGEISFFLSPEEEKELLRMGNRIIIPPITLRDMKIDLLFYTDTVDYKYK